MEDVVTTTPSEGLGPSSAPVEARRQLVVVGHGMVSHHFVQNLVQRQAAASITVFGDEGVPAYDRVKLTSLFAGVAPAALSLADVGWYQQHGVELVQGDAVVSIDLQAKVVLTASGRRQGYHELVLATGAEARLPPITGVNGAGVLLYRNLADVQRIRDAALKSFSAVVIGGGLLGLEAAHALAQLGKQVTVVENARFLMPRQLDPDGGAVLADIIRGQGIEVRVGAQVRSVRAIGNRYSVDLAGAESLSADMVVLAVGVRPNDGLARAAGLLCGPAGGVVVDSKLATSDPHVHAIGDCALFAGHNPGLVAPGYQMAAVLARRLSGDTDARFDLRLPSTRLKVAGVDVSVMGNVANAGEFVVRQAGDQYRKLFLSRGNLVAAIVVGPWPERDRVEQAIERGKFLFRWKLRSFRKGEPLFTDAPSNDVRAWPDGSTVCHCVGVDCGTLRQARATGAANADALTACTRAGSLCGSCRPLLVRLCDADDTPARRTSAPGLLIASALAALTGLLHPLLPPIAVIDSITNKTAELLWRNAENRQLTGFGLLGLCALAAAFSLRKRWFPRLGALPVWRAVHAALGLTVLLALIVHTGLAVPHNFNRALWVDFLALNGAGALAGIFSARRFNLVDSGPAARRLRWLHLLLLVPFPALLAFHILAVYYF